MINIEEIISDQVKNSIFHLRNSNGLQLLLSKLEEHHLEPYYIDFTRIITEGDFFVECKKVFNFPDGFGNNWNALRDFLRDDYFINRANNVVICNEMQHFFYDKPDTFALLIEIFECAAEFRRKVNWSSLTLILVGDFMTSDINKSINVPELTI